MAPTPCRELAGTAKNLTIVRILLQRPVRRAGIAILRAPAAPEFLPTR